MTMKSKFTLLTLACALPLTSALFAQDAPSDDKAAEAELAKKLQNPIASLISVPIQNNWDFGIGSANAMKYTANIQPVIPFSLSQDWNLITRTIMPLIYAESPTKGGTDHSGLGDITQSFFFRRCPGAISSMPKRISPRMIGSTTNSASLARSHCRTFSSGAGLVASLNTLASTRKVTQKMEF